MAQWRARTVGALLSLRSNRISGCGGIGRHARFRFWWATVQVQVLSPALRKGVSGSCPRPLFSVWVETLNLSSRSRLRLGRSRTNVHWTLWVFVSLRSVQSKCPLDILHPCHPHAGGDLEPEFKVVFVSLRSVQYQRPPDGVDPVTRIRRESLEKI